MLHKRRIIKTCGGRGVIRNRNTDGEEGIFTPKTCKSKAQHVIK